MNEYMLYATGSAQPIKDASLTFFVTANPEPLLKYFILGAVFGVFGTLSIILLNNLIWIIYDRLLQNRSNQDKS